MIIPYGRQSIDDTDISAVVSALKSDLLTQGPKVAEFEKSFAEYVQAKYAVAVSNGTAALHLCALALGVNTTTRVITTPITFVASANCILYCGGSIELCDINAGTGLMDIIKLEEMLASKPVGYYKGIVAVDFAGYPIDLEKMKALAEKYLCWIIEDACHSPGAYFTDSVGNKQLCGNGVFADLAVFSFHPVKHIATGEGGMITTNDENLYKKLLSLRTHGITRDPEMMTTSEGGWYYQMLELGYNYRIPDMLCALGITQLSKAAAGIKRRLAIAERYDEAFGGNEHITQLTPNGTNDLLKQGTLHAHHLYVIKVADRKGLYNHLRSNGVYAQIHYIPIHTMPFYRNSGFTDIVMPEAEAYYTGCISLPMFPALTDDEQEYVISKVVEFVENGHR
ncbi:MAG: UDP-4-amino-4,6-dideoxy-N-acetyl-beta-L-altrosamine transaminase [Sphingobacteriaceae bacterium]|nr:UDP-4-amino-4,6-dideoxy-N-acetyl-beta-L-altrosamine transaminase [Sphingobacteriaceae bacterium]